MVYLLNLHHLKLQLVTNYPKGGKKKINGLALNNGCKGNIFEVS